MRLAGIYQIVVCRPIVGTSEASALEMILRIGALLPSFERICVKVKPVIDADLLASPYWPNDADDLVILKLCLELQLTWVEGT